MDPNQPSGSGDALSLLQLWLVGWVKFATLKANFGGGRILLVYPILLFSLTLSVRSLEMTEILLTGTYSLNAIKKTSRTAHATNMF